MLRYVMPRFATFRLSSHRQIAIPTRVFIPRAGRFAGYPVRFDVISRQTFSTSQNKLESGPTELGGGAHSELPGPNTIQNCLLIGGQKLHNTIGDENTKRQKKGKSKRTTPYSNMSMADAEQRLGFRMRELKAISVSTMLAEAKYKRQELEDGILKTKENVYNAIIQYLNSEGYPAEENSDFNEANVSDLVFAIISPMLSDFRRKTGRNLRLRRQEEIISVDGETGGEEEFVVVDLVSVTEEKCVLIVAAKRASLGEAVRQCLLSMKDTRENNGSGEVYGFATTGESWRMFKYDGESFRKTVKIEVLFDTMEGEKETWMKDCSVLVDCMNMALGSGGIVKKDVVASA